jgi:hypothetical protein
VYPQVFSLHPLSKSQFASVTDILCVYASPSGRAVQGVRYLHPLKHWDLGIEYHGCPVLQREQQELTNIEGISIPESGRGGPWGCETSRLPHFLDNRLTDGGEVVSLTRWRAALYRPGRFLVLISVRG